MSEITRILKIIQDQQKFLKEELLSKNYLNSTLNIDYKYDINITAEKLALISTILQIIGPVKQEL